MMGEGNPTCTVVHPVLVAAATRMGRVPPAAPGKPANALDDATAKLAWATTAASPRHAGRKAQTSRTGRIAIEVC